VSSWRQIKPWLKIGLTFAFSAVFAYFFLRDLDFRQVGDDLLDADYALVPPALGLFGLSLVARAYRWRCFYEPDSPPAGMLLRVLLIDYAGNNLLPLRGGEIVRAQLLLDRGGVSRMRTVGTAIVERLFDMLVLGVFVVLGRFVVNTGPAFLGTGLLLCAGSLFGFAVAWLIVRNPHLPSRVLSWRWPLLTDRWRERFGSWSGSVVNGFAVLASGSRFRLAVVLTMAAWLLEFAMYWLIAEAFSIHEGFLTIAFAGASANLALSLPSAQGGVGAFQLVAKEALLKFGLPVSAVAAYAVALHVLLVAPVTLVGLAVFWVMVPAHKRELIETTLET
jgi:uncharacterized protein (TIRG00374 family)